jgi:hypothetical protein
VPPSSGRFAAVNYLLNPLRFSSSAMSEVASVLVGGKNYLVHDGNLDWRAFRREYIRRMRPRLISRCSAAAAGRRRRRHWRRQPFRQRVRSQRLL